ncbi:DNA polymerase III subunit epsilon-like [Perca fluviatilis]|nr:DNA polymerase III subunit epsilon-like [Perca fluviatilis]
MAYGATIVFFDLQTTGYDTPSCHITQLSAICKDKRFNVYTFPFRDIHPVARRLTGFTVSYGRLCLHGRPVGTVPIFYALNSFINYLSNFPGPVLLAAHNAKRFDALILSRLLQRFSLWQRFQRVVSGFVDTFILSRKLFPDLPRHNQESLVYYFLGESYYAYNALKNATMLQKLFISWRPSSFYVKEVTFFTEEFVLKSYKKYIYIPFKY